jgi:hypothetical protein
MEISRKNTVLILVIVLILAYLGTWYTQKMHSQIESMESLADAEHREATIWRNKDSTSQAEIKNAYATADAIGASRSEDLEMAEKKISGLRRDLKNLQTIVSTSVSTSGSVTVKLEPIFFSSTGQPEISSRAFAYSDRWVSLRGNFLRDSVQIDYLVKDDLSVVQYWKRQPGLIGVFKPRELYTDVISNNPNSSITKLSSTSVRPKKSTRLGLDVGAGYAPGLGPAVYIGVGYRLIEF